jgi:seryl-tRNA synthetase
VPVSKDEVDNRVERTWGKINETTINSTPGSCHHHEIMSMIDGYDMKRGAKIAGHRGYYLKGAGVLLN